MRCACSGLDTVRGTTQRKLAQGEQIGPAKELLGRRGGVLGYVDLSGAQTSEELVGRQIDELDFVGFVEHTVGQRLTLPHAGDLRHHIVQALEMLHVDGGPYVDARGENLFDVLPALRVSRSGSAPIGFEWASSSTIRIAGRRLSAASRLNSWRTTPR